MIHKKGGRIRTYGRPAPDLLGWVAGLAPLVASVPETDALRYPALKNLQTHPALRHVNCRLKSGNTWLVFCNVIRTVELQLHCNGDLRLKGVLGKCPTGLDRPTAEMPLLGPVSLSEPKRRKGLAPVMLPHRLQSVGALISHSPMKDNDSLVKLGYEFGFLGEEERPILANSEFLLTQEGFAGTSNKVHVRLHSKATWSSLPTADSIPVFYPTALTLEPVTLVAVIASSTGYESKGVKAFLLRWGLRTLFSVVLEYAYVTSSIKSKSGYSPSGKTEEKWDIAKLSIPLEISIPIEWTDVCFKKLAIELTAIEFLTAAKDKKDVTGVKVRRVTALVVVAALGTDSFPGLNARGAGSYSSKRRDNSSRRTKSSWRKEAREI
ncbi:hypothetical protein RHSIM_RhsimMtG0005300 (mitochondrion) [Rhododendron simsii]|uniref:Uncharacterized protein n=1 Tax=Rhododendron simsii TaxID=118357 RepID=A0A834L5Z5_RHOSS|nr:hypothetical protein RHSIM_RhsimMtG0005300 [Rhododendron simsii]